MLLLYLSSNDDGDALNRLLNPRSRMTEAPVCPSEETAVPYRREAGDRKQHWATPKHGENTVTNSTAKCFPHRTLNHKVYMQLVCRPRISLTRQTVLTAPDGHTNPLCHPARRMIPVISAVISPKNNRQSLKHIISCKQKLEVVSKITDQ